MYFASVGRIPVRATTGRYTSCSLVSLSQAQTVEVNSGLRENRLRSGQADSFCWRARRSKPETELSVQQELYSAHDQLEWLNVKVPTHKSHNPPRTDKKLRGRSRVDVRSTFRYCQQIGIERKIAATETDVVSFDRENVVVINEQLRCVR